MKSFHLLYFTFLLLQKSNKKRAPKTITPRFREGALIKLLYYCSFKSGSLTANLKTILIELQVYFNKHSKIIISYCVPKVAGYKIQAFVKQNYSFYSRNSGL